MPVYKNQKAKGDKKWYYQFYTGEKVNGTRKKMTRRGFKTKKEAEEALVKAKSAYLSGRYVEPSKKTYATYLREWLNTRRNLGEQTRDLYDSYLRTHILPELGQIPLARLSAHDLEGFLNVLYGKGLAAATVKRIFSVVNASLNAAWQKELIPKNPAGRVEKPQIRQRREVMIWEPGYVGDFLQRTRGESRYWIAVYLAIMTGMRQGEILGLRWGDIDIEKRNLTIRQTVTRKRQIKQGAKTRLSLRSIALSPETVEMLTEHRQRIELERQQHQQDYRDHDLVVCTRTGEPAASRAIQKTWERFLQKTGAPKITFHDLRHTHASLLIRQGVHIKVISERLGHSSVSITMDTYGHLLPNMQEQAASSLDALLKATTCGSS